MSMVRFQNAAKFQIAKTKWAWSSQGKHGSWASMSGFIFGERRVGKMSPLEGQRCSNAFSNEQGSDIRHTCLWNDGGVVGKAQEADPLGGW